MIFKIHEDNMERLQKKLATIQRKCEAYGCDFTFSIVGEEFSKTKSGAVIRYVLVDADGKAIINGWEFVGTIEHHTPRNVMRILRVEHTIPEEYLTAQPHCDHCNTTRARTDTYLIRNVETGEFKQVGKSCLKSYTNGLDAKLAASCEEWLHELETGFEVGASPKSYYERLSVLAIAQQYIKHCGFVKTTDCYDSTPTAHRVLRYMNDDTLELKQLDKDGVTIDENSDEAKTIAQITIEWVLAQQNPNDYIGNLQAVLNEEYITSRNFGLAVSAIQAYRREVERNNRKIEKAATESNSRHIGTVGERLMLTGQFQYITGWETQYGFTSLYKFTTTDGNICTWKTGNGAPTEDIVTIKATVKDHTVYNGTNQTELTRCKVQA